MSIDMTKLNGTQRAVIERLDKEYEGCRTAGSHGAQLNGPVLNVLKGFCASDAEFAQLLHDSDKTLKGCFEAVSKQGYSGTSDFEVYSNAIRYYLPGVTVHMTLWVDVQGVDEGVAFGRDGEATLDVYGKGKVTERKALSAAKGGTSPEVGGKAKEAKGKKDAEAAERRRKEDKEKKERKAAEVLPAPDLAKQQTSDDLLDVPVVKKAKVLSFDFLDL